MQRSLTLRALVNPLTVASTTQPSVDPASMARKAVLRIFP
jgi:hypothetical protein